MTDAKTVAEYMTFELKRRGGVLYQYDIADRIIQRFGREFVASGPGPCVKIRKDVLRAFRAMNPDTVWDLNIFGWHVK